MIALESDALKIWNKMELTQVWATLYSWAFLMIDTVVIFIAHDKNGAFINRMLAVFSDYLNGSNYIF